MAKAKTPTTKTTAKKATESKRGTAKKTSASKALGDSEVVMDRRRKDRRGNEKEEAASEKPVIQRREKVNRRRQIDPTTCERDYSNEEIEFMQALDAYKRANGRMFPTCSEILEVVRGLGYHRGPVEESVVEEVADRDADGKAPEQAVPAITDEVEAIQL
ncbi:MAG: hypothetical protein WD045_01895 [Pirellulaceae bacterium]